MSEPLLYINIPWMKRYQGAHKGDVPSGGFKYTKAHPLNDHTQFNFKPYRGRFFGHVPGSTSPNLERLGATSGAKFLDGVTVVWIAMHPDSNERIVVGWYKGARVWRSRQSPDDEELERMRTTPTGGICDYSVEAPARSSRLLLPPESRPRLFLRGGTRKGRPGQNPYWYGNDVTNRRALKIIADPRAAMERVLPVAAKRSHPGWIQNTEERLKIEAAAMDFVMKSYEQDGYQVTDVSEKNLGYDILAKSSNGELHLEVKGKKSGDVFIELTPNEYRYARSNRATFRVCIVLNALGKSQLVELAFRAGRWFDREGKEFTGTEKPSLIISG